MRTTGTAVGQVELSLNDGQGGFAAPTVLSRTLPGIPVALAAGDFNGDGRADLAVVSTLRVEETARGQVSVLLNTGNGAFAAPTVLPWTWEGRPKALVAGDFNGDGQTDLALEDTVGNVALLLNQGNGAFGEPILHSRESGD
ncbi:MAG: VCBS repeat-containing protein [Gemmataceae bacterium]|nr:VCBS repeat-containing protein [Gemmataceae bacterium]